MTIIFITRFQSRSVFQALLLCLQINASIQRVESNEVSKPLSNICGNIPVFCPELDSLQYIGCGYDCGHARVGLEVIISLGWRKSAIWDPRFKDVCAAQRHQRENVTVCVRNHT